MRRQVVVHALAERLGALVILRHLQHAPRFAIADAVEHLVDLIRRIGLCADRPRHALRVIVERAIQAGGVILRNVPLGVPHRDRLGLHPGREPLVEPDVVPPLHCHHIAKPLMRHFMRDHVGNSLLRLDRRRLLVDQQIGFAIRDRAEILHRPCFKVRQADHVELRHRIANAEVRVVVVQNEFSC